MFKLFGKKEETVSLDKYQATVRAMAKNFDRAIEQRDAARAEAEANRVDAEELEQWRKYGQMRDPATGRLIPRVKAEVA